MIPHDDVGSAMAKSGLLMVGQNGVGGRSLFQSDGSPAGTRELLALPTGSITALQSLGNGLAAFQLDGSAIWVTDGTAAGTKALGPGAELSVLRPGVAVFTDSTSIHRLGFTDGVSFTLSDAFFAATLNFRSTSVQVNSPLTPQGDGSAVFTIERIIVPPFTFFDLAASTAGFAPAAAPGSYGAWIRQVSQGADVTALEFNAANFTALPTNTGFGFARTNLMAVGDIADWTRLDGDRAIVSYRPNTGAGTIPAPVVDARGIEPWVVSLSGRTLLADINPTGDSTPQNLANVGGARVAFIADAGAGLGRELWITDGTAAGTTALGDLRPGEAGSDASGFTPLVAGRFVFGANDGMAGRELWISDGTSLGTHLLADLLPGAAGSDPGNFVVLGDGRVAFIATGSGGTQAWVTDGTTAGTVGFGVGLAVSNLAATTLFDGLNTTAKAFFPLFGVPVTGSARDDALRGTNLDDTFFWSAGDDVLDGGAGNDTASYRDFNLRLWSTSYSPTGGLKLFRPGETDTLISINEVSFIDGDLTFDAESRIAVVTRLYQAALGHGPDQATLHAGSTALDPTHGPGNARLTVNQLAASIITSNDFVTVHGGNQSDTAFVDGLYTNGLGRAADVGGLTFWTGFLASGGSRAEVLTGFGQSAEMRNNTAAALSTGLWNVNETAAQIARLYLAALDRAPDLPGLIGDRNYLSSAPPLGAPGPNLKDVAASMLASDEFNRIPGGDDASFVIRLYATALDRMPDAPGFAGWTARMHGGMSRADVLIGFSESIEHIALSAPLVMPEASHGIVFA
jgi:ELWxxDGT repeat protein